MTDNNVADLYQRTLDQFLRSVHQQFQASNRLANEWEEFEDEFRRKAAQHWPALSAQLTAHERHSTLRNKIQAALTELLDDDPHFQEAVAAAQNKARVAEAVAKLDDDIWFMRLARLLLQLRIYLMEAETDDFLTESDRMLHERFRNRTRMPRNPIHWRGGGAVVIEPTDDPVALSYLRDSETVIMTRHAGGLAAAFARLKGEAHGLLNYFNKHEFYQKMALSAKSVLDAEPDASERELVLAMLRAATEVLSSWERDRYKAGALNVVDAEKLAALRAAVQPDHSAD